MKVLAVLLALTSLCQAMQNPVRVSYGGPSGNGASKTYPSCYPGQDCYDTICYWFNSNKGSPEVYVDYERPFPFLSIAGFNDEYYSFNLDPNDPCQLHDMCQICGTYGECETKKGGYRSPVCECDDGYTGDFCEEKDDDDDTTIIIIIVVIVVLVILIVVIVILCCCCGRGCNGDCGDCDCYGDHPRRRRHPFKRPFHHGHPQVVPQPVPLPQPGFQGNIGFNPVPHQDPITPTLQVSEIRENGQVNGLNTYIIKNESQNVTSYVTHPTGPTVITNMPTNDGTGYGVNPSTAVFT